MVSHPGDYYDWRSLIYRFIWRLNVELGILSFPNNLPSYRTQWSQIETLSLIFWMNPNRIIKQCESEGRLNKPGTITGNYKQVKAWHQNLLCIITRVNDIITINLNVNSPTFIFGREVDPISTDQCSSLILSSSWRSDNDVGERCWRQADQYDLVLFKIVLSPMSSYLY